MSKTNEGWLEGWKTGQIGFHKTEFHSFLNSYFAQLSLESIHNVLVPLCGKSLDMIYLAEKGLDVTGVELSPIACQQFFEDNQIEFTREGNQFTSKKITLLCGDLFEQELPKFDLIYDRAAYVALGPEVRKRYAELLRSSLTSSGQVLLTTFFHPDIKTGPPHSISDEEITEFLRPQKLERLRQEDRPTPPRHQESGIETWQERAYLLKF